MQIKTIKLSDGRIKMVNQDTLNMIIDKGIPFKVIERKEI